MHGPCHLHLGVQGPYGPGVSWGPENKATVAPASVAQKSVTQLWSPGHCHGNRLRNSLLLPCTSYTAKVTRARVLSVAVKSTINIGQGSTGNLKTQPPYGTWVCATETNNGIVMPWTISQKQHPERHPQRRQSPSEDRAQVNNHSIQQLQTRSTESILCPEVAGVLGRRSETAPTDAHAPLSMTSP